MSTNENYLLNIGIKCEKNRIFVRVLMGKRESVKRR